VAFSPDGNYLAALLNGRQVRIWDAAASQEVEGSTNHILQTSGFSNTMFTAWDGSVRTWVASPPQRRFQGYLTNDGDVAFSSDGRYIAGGRFRDFVARVWSLAPFAEVQRTRRHSDSINAVAFSPDVRYLATGGVDRAITLTEMSTGAQVLRIEAPDEVRSLAFSPDGKYIVSGGADSLIRLWDVASGRQVRQFAGHSHAVSAVTFSPDGKLIASGSLDASIKIWEADSGRSVITFLWLGNDEWIAAASDGRFDTNRPLDRIKGLHWVVGGEYLRPVALEAFMRQYFEPGLMSRSLRCSRDGSCAREFKALPAIAKINRSQPGIRLRQRTSNSEPSIKKN
jgi:WD40 repeat protein